MPTLIIKDRIATYDAADHHLTERGTFWNDNIDRTTTTANAQLVTVSSLPRYFVMGQWGWDGEKLYPLPVFLPDILAQAKKDKLAQIDAETSATILAGFDYEIDGTTYHFNYDAFDQQNFVDTASMCQLALAGTKGLPESVTWNSYSIPDGTLVQQTFDAASFLTLYTAGAMAHKATKMTEGGTRKAAVAAAETLEDIEKV